MKLKIKSDKHQYYLQRTCRTSTYIYIYIYIYYYLGNKITKNCSSKLNKINIELYKRKTFQNKNHLKTTGGTTVFGQNESFPFRPLCNNRFRSVYNFSYQC